MGKELTKEKIIVESIELFMNYGVRSVTMDDIAKHLGMSKKTIYQHFKDKEDIVIQATAMAFEEEERKFNEIEATAKNAVEQLYMLTVCLRDRIKLNTNSSILYDLKKYYPRAWEKYRKYKHDVIYDSVMRNLKLGMTEGLFRININPEVLAHLRIGEVELSFNKEFFPEEKFNLVEIHSQLFDHFTYGILSEEGIKLYETYKQNNNINETI